MRPTSSATTPLVLTLLSGLVLGASVQDGDEPSGPPVPAPTVPVRTIVGPLQELPPSADELPSEATVQGPWREIPLVERDDAVPQLVVDLLVAAPDGDQRIAGLPQDPYFLGFAAGNHYPPAGERVDPELAALAAAGRVDARPQDVVYAFVMFSRRITPERIAQLEALGLRDLGSHPHHSRKVALPVGALDAVASLPFVRWVGLAREWQKVHPALASLLSGAAPDARLDVWVSLFECDLNAASDPAVQPVYEAYDANGSVAVPEVAAPTGFARTRGWQERELQELGLELGEYLDGSRSFRARIDAARVAELVRRDFVQFVSPDVEAYTMHDESMPLVNADAFRATYDGANDSQVVVGVVDSGITIAHGGFSGKWAAGWDFTDEAAGAWMDLRQHGSHVAGTVCGNGSIEDSWAGAAPGLGAFGPTGRLFNYKIVDSNNTLNGVNFNTLFTYMSQGWTDGNGNATPKPMILNNSWGHGSTLGGWHGTEPLAVDYDEEIYDNRQLHVFSAGNAGPDPFTISYEGSCKNVLTVGGVLDFNSAGQGAPGALWDSSSIGPTADGRWKPSVVAPATSVLSIKPLTGSEYSKGTGTSMAAPHVTGIAAQLLDHYAFLRTHPATTSAVLMATATTKDDDAIVTAADGHLYLYGAGRANAGRAHGSTTQHVLSFWGWSSASGNSTIEVDIPVNEGATRLTVALVYHEEGASVGANKALVNDWDMWIDRAPFSAGGNTGEYFAHQSPRDNVELRTINNPHAVTHRIKLYPEDVSSTCRIGLAVSVVYGDTTPDGSLQLTASDAYVQPGETVTIRAAAYNPSFWASSVFLNSSSSINMVLEDSTATLKDGTTASFMNNSHQGRDVLVGDIRHGQTRAVEWTPHWNTEGTKTWTVTATSDNWVDKMAQVQVVVDGTDPGLVSNLTSTSHQPGVWSNEPSIDYAWTAAVDLLSGVDGYGIFTSNSPAGAPSATKDIEAVTAYSEVLATNALPYYFKVRTVDRSGNWSAGFAVTGGYLIDTVAPTAAVGLASSSHQPGVDSCLTQVTMNWGAASDAHSGLAGYIALWNQSPLTIPVAGTQLAAGATSLTQTLGEGDDWYFHLRSIDVAGNLGATVHAGPYSIDLAQWTTYCTAKVTSSLCIPSIEASGAATLGAPEGFAITSTLLEPQKNAIGFFGLTGPAAAPFQGGFLCVQAPVYRLPLKSSGGAGDCTGQLEYTLAELLAHPSGGALVTAGAVVNMQSWFRDPLASFGSGLSNGIEFLICP